MRDLHEEAKTMARVTGSTGATVNVQHSNGTTDTATYTRPADHVVQGLKLAAQVSIQIPVNKVTGQRPGDPLTAAFPGNRVTPEQMEAVYEITGRTEQDRLHRAGSAKWGLKLTDETEAAWCRCQLRRWAMIERDTNGLEVALSK